MSVCRTCLASPAEKYVSELEMENKNYFDIMLFCLDIEVIKNSKVTTHLCNTCYEKIISFTKFKLQSLKNDNYLKSLEPLDSLQDHKASVYVDPNGIKHENTLHNDEWDTSEVKDNIEVIIKTEFKHEDTISDEEKNVKNRYSPEDVDPDIEPLSVVQKIKEQAKTKTSSRVTNKIAVRKKRRRSKKAKPGYQACEECGKSVVNLRRHMAMHLRKKEQKMVKCDNCPKQFFTKHGQQEHYKTAHLGMKSKCDICNKEVVYSYLKTHKMLAHHKDKLPLGCVSCGSRFLTQSALATHMFAHNVDVELFNVECDVCHIKCRNKQFLSSHMRRVHEKERKYQCEFCSKGFFAKYGLQRHIRIHTNEKPYKCEECGKCFTTDTSLKNHRLSHVTVKNLHCEHCDMGFVSINYLQRHMVKHTKEKKYPCRICGRRFGRSDNRYTHERTAHQIHLTASELYGRSEHRCMHDHTARSPETPHSGLNTERC